MPSSHAATVCSLATGTLLEYGAGTFEFAFAAIFAIVVLYDARGVRLETGKQAEVLNSIIDGLENEHKLIIPKLELKELVGHTPFQVFIGSLLGIILTPVSYTHRDVYKRQPPCCCLWIPARFAPPVWMLWPPSP